MWKERLKQTKNFKDCQVLSCHGAAKYFILKEKYMSGSGKLKAYSQPGLKQVLWNVFFLEHKAWRKSVWKKAKNVFTLPFFFGRIRPSNGFSLAFPVCVCFFQEKVKKEVGGGNQPLNLYTTWGEFHPMSTLGIPIVPKQTSLYTLISWLRIPPLGCRLFPYLLSVPLPPYHYWKWGATERVKHSVNAVKSSHETSSPLLEIYQKERLMLFCLHKDSFSATLSTGWPKNCGL